MAKRPSKAEGKARKPERFTCLDIGFKSNDQLKTNTCLHKESAKIESKVIWSGFIVQTQLFWPIISLGKPELMIQGV
jgi:hypothetical protein